MGISQLERLANQVKNAGLREVRRETNQFRRSLVGQARQIYSRAGQALDPDQGGPAVPAGPPRRTPPEAEFRTEQEPVVCADGYVRRSPVQPYRRGDMRGRRRRIVLWVLAVILIVLLAAALWRGGLLSL